MSAYRWELHKLRRQRRTLLGLLGVLAPSLIFGVALSVRSGEPAGAAFGAFVRETALAFPLVNLFFGAFWLFPLITALVAGDIVAAEWQRGTIKTILTRSVSRTQLFWAKVAATASYTIAAMVVMAAGALTVGAVLAGVHPLPGLSGQEISVPRGLALIGASLVVYLLPLLALAAFGILLSVITRNSAGAVVGTLMLAFMLRLVELLPGLEPLGPFLITSQFEAWQGLMRDPLDLGPAAHAAWVCVAWSAPCLGLAWIDFTRRDVTA